MYNNIHQGTKKFWPYIFFKTWCYKKCKVFFFYPVICNIIHHLKYIHSHNKICMRIENEQNIFLSLKLNMKVAVNRYLRGEMVLYFIGAFIGSWITIKAIKFISHLSFTSNCFNLLFFFGEWRCCKRECITALKE